MRHAFRHRMKISSLYIISHRLAILSGIVPQWYDCCVNSCVAYIGDHEDFEQCPECSQPRWISGSHTPRRMFCYIPLIPRLQNFFTNPQSHQEILYRHNYKSTGNSISDVFDGQHYKDLCNTWVTVDGSRLSHKFFSDKRDIAFSTCLDSYLLYKHRRSGPSAMPILIQILNLPPEIRSHLSHVICVGVIPGPKAPKQVRTFLYPLENECAKLARGIPTRDFVDNTTFDLHAYNIFTSGDIIAIEKFLNIKGHNGICPCPCRSCNMKAVNDQNDSGDKTYYIPLTHPGKSRRVDPRNLERRKHDDWAIITFQIRKATTKKGKNLIAMHHGIKGIPALSYRVNSMDFARGVPWDFMHLLYENVVKNLVNLWKGRYKGLDEGTQTYIIPDHIWKQIGEETVAAIKDIPSAFVRSLGNINDDQANYTAEGWAFWFMYLAPFLLKNRLSNNCYRHMCQLVEIMKTCIQFTLQHNEIDALETQIIAWVQEYER